MCFIKTKESEVLIAEKDIKVYKIGISADNTSFTPFFVRAFDYPANKPVYETVKFFGLIINQGLHSYINCLLDSVSSIYIDLYTSEHIRYTIPLEGYTYTVFLGEFIIPNGAAYCSNCYDEVVSDALIYTGRYIKLEPYKKYDTKELWKEKQVKYLLIRVKLIKQQRVSDVMAVLLTEVLSAVQAVQLENFQVVVILLKEKIILTQYLKK